jgi:hypothetical protein
MALWIACLVLALPVRLIGGFVVDLCTCVSSANEVRVNVGDMNHESCASQIYRLGRTELVLRGDAVKPNGCSTDADFAVNRFAIRSALDAS